MSEKNNPIYEECKFEECKSEACKFEKCKLKQRKLIEARIKEIRELNNQENDLINHRLTWLGLIQALLVNAFILVVDKYMKDGEHFIPYLCIVIALTTIGILISISFRKSLNLAHTALSNLKDLYGKLRKMLKEMGYPNEYECPIAIGLFCNDTENVKEKKRRISLAPWTLMPILFIGLWSVFLVAFILLFGIFKI